MLVGMATKEFLPGVPPEALTTIGLIGGWLVARRTRREVGGIVFAAFGAMAGARWAATVSKPAAAALGLAYSSAMGLSHPLSKRIGPWPAVLTVAGAVAAASLVARKALPAGS